MSAAASAALATATIRRRPMPAPGCRGPSRPTRSGSRARVRYGSRRLRGEGLTDRLGEHEADVLLDDLELLDLLGAAGAEEGDQALDELLGRAGPGGDPDHARALEPLLEHLLLAVDQVRVGAELARHLDEAVGVRGVARADDEDEVAMRRHLLDGRLAVRRRVADVVGAGADDAREALAQT